ncbi:fungal-specific transcription factor domain-containing protein [Colletotrichum godetiae]|uniref:Fungal-specific transcription factor domain-containing protein n=1 Tax=Colletotrichum godetiae TaxID=1209918 RepID=A0AAJ0ANP7_9PEZI|nr:fungal-specific transcription factor domain-containing protein [Colletotrichum godetiae]KAK1676595.1 fungal-specific transcription factor domain-containing protein [Colletotrichum godetiae]
MTIIKDEAGQGSNDDAGIIAQENTAPRIPSLRQAKNQQVRHRASVACASCRDRRIRCVVPKGESECVQCKKAGNECVIKNDDERRRPISKAYMSSLSDRIAMLEGMLQEKGVQPPPAVHPPKTRHETHQMSEEPREQRRFPAKGPIVPEVPSPPDSGNDDYSVQGSDHAENASNKSPCFHVSAEEQSAFRMLDPAHENVVHRLLSTRGNLSFDQLSGRLRFFGPTANSHVYYADTSDSFRSREPSEQIRRAERIIRTLTATTHDYLMSNFWTHYNSVLKIIHRDSFESDRESQSPKFYSSFLHIAILAMGFRFADCSRDDMKRIALGNRESTLHREAKYMLDVELERPGGIPSVQALLLLGDLECGVGRDNTGWMYAGMANRLAFDIGLHLDCRNSGFDDREVDIRHMVMRACVIYDKYWSLFLGRPTSIKSQDVGMDLLSRRFSQLTSLMGTPGPTNQENQTVEIYDQLVELMELAGRIVEARDSRQAPKSAHERERADGEEDAYLQSANLDRQLQNWYRRLPEHLQWKPANIKHAPFSYFLLHQQYHVSMILLHRSWAKYDEVAGDTSSTDANLTPNSSADSKDMPDQHHFDSLGTNISHSTPDTGRVASSRSICSFHAIRVARVFWQHRQRFDGTKIFITGIQHAGTAAIALIAALAYHRCESDRRTYLGYLEILASAISDMSQAYQPAARMDNLLKAVLGKLRTDTDSLDGVSQPPVILTGSEKSLLSSPGWRGTTDNIYSVLPARREAEVRETPPTKRRRPSTSSRRASEFARPPLPFFGGKTQPSTRRSSQSNVYANTGSPLEPAAFHSGGNDHQLFNLDFLNGSAIDNDRDDDASDAKSKPVEDCIFVSPLSNSWVQDNTINGNASPSQKANLRYGDLDLHDWESGASGIGLESLSSFQLSGGGESSRENQQKVPKEEHNQSTFKNDTKDTITNQGGFGPFGHEAMDWMGTGGGLDTMTSVSLIELVQSSIAGKGERRSADEVPRNHELDFLSF